MVVETVNEDKPTWWSFLAWPIVGAALAVSVLGMMTIGLFVFPFALLGLLAMLKWGGNPKSRVGLLSGVGLPFIYIAYLNRGGPGMVCSPYANGGQQCTQEYSPWPFLIVGAILILLGVVMFLRIRTGSGISKNFKGALVLILVIFVMTFGLIVHPSTSSRMGTESARVQYSFKTIFAALSKNEGTPTQRLSPIRVDVDTRTDGSKVSLWIPNFGSSSPRPECYAVDVVSNKSGPAGYFTSSCKATKVSAILDRQESSVVGFINGAKATKASVTVLGRTVVVPMVFGYFLVPESLAQDPHASFTITYTEPDSSTCTFRNLEAPGSFSLSECVIA